MAYYKVAFEQEIRKQSCDEKENIMNQIYTSDLLSFQKRLAPTVDSDVVIDRPKTEILPEPYVITHERKIRFKLYLRMQEK